VSVLVNGAAIDEAVMVRLVMAAAMVALTVVLFAGCGGGGGDRARVEANLQDYLVSLVPRDSAFPIGAGAPRVKDNGCFKLEKGSVGPSPQSVLVPRSGSFRTGIARWNCVVEFGTVAMPVAVTVDKSSEVVAAAPGGMLRQPKPRIYQNRSKPVSTTRAGGSN
jgi:hypothetical protein